MRKTFNVLAISLVLGLATASLQAGVAIAADTAPGKITVSASGDVTSAPDMASVSVGVTSQARTAEAALAANTSQMQGLMGGLKDRGLPEDDIQTSNFNLQPLWNNGSGQARKITGYQVSNQVHVRITDLSKLGGLLDQLVAGGANNFYGLQFGLKDPRLTQDRALALAVGRARAKAELLAAAVGVELGRLVDMQETGGGIVQPMMRAAAMEMDAAPIAQGQVSTTTSVTLIYEIVEQN